MKKKDTKARMQIIFGALILALFFSVELYMMINYSDKYLIIAGIALVELIFLYVIIQGIFALKEEKEIRNEAQYDNVFKSEKASYLMLKKYFEEFEDKLNYLEKASKVPTEEIVNAQKGIAKVVMNRTRQGSEAMLNSTEQIADQLAEVQKQSEAFQSLLSSCKEEIMKFMQTEKKQKSAGNSSEKSVQMQIQDLVVQMKDMELRLNAALSQNQKVIVQSAPASFGTTSDEKSFLNEVMADEVADTDDDLEETVEPEPVVVPEPNSAPEPVAAPEPIPEPEPVAAPEPIPEPESVAAPEPIPEPEPVVAPEPASDSNRSLSPDEIAALFANMGNDSTSEAKEEPVQEPAPEVIEKPTVAEKTEAPADSTQPMPDSSDPNKTLSPDEIAALFANMGN